MADSIDYKKNIPKILILNLVWATLVIIPVIVPFFQSRGLNMEQVYQLQSIFAIAVLLLEVPSGYLSDLWGRKNTLFVATVFHGLGYTIFVFSEGFIDLVIAELMLAAAISLFSGTDLSIIYDSLLASGSKKAPIKLVGRKMFYAQLGEAIGGLLGGWLVYISLEAPAVASAIVAWFPIFVIFYIQEPPREKMDKKKHKENIIYVYTSLFKHSRLLNLIIFNFIFAGLAGLVAFWSFQKYWESLLIPIFYFGYLHALGGLTVAFTSRYAHKIEKKIGSSITITIMGILPVVAYFGMSYIEAAWGFLFCLLFQIARGINNVVLKDALNKRVTSDMRATANSVASLGTRLIFIFVGPAVGYAIDKGSLKDALFYLGLSYIIVFLVLVLPFLAQRKNFAPIK